MFIRKETQETTVSLRSICCKTLEHIIYSSIFSHFDEYNALQQGFRSKRLCESQLLGVVNDFSKARLMLYFLTLPRLSIRYHISGSARNFYIMVLSIRNFLHEQSQVVVINGHCSGPCPVFSIWLPQGTILAPK